LKDDIDYYLGNEEREEKKKEEKKKNDLNPFSALFNIFKRDKDKESKDGDKIKKDSYIEEVVRKLAEKQAIGTCFDIFDIYKKGHQMPSPPPQFYGDH